MSSVQVVGKGQGGGLEYWGDVCSVNWEDGQGFLSKLSPKL